MSIEIVLLIAAVAITCFVALAWPPRARRYGVASDAETRDETLNDHRNKHWH